MVVNESLCADSQTFPSLEEYQDGLGPWATLLYIFSGFTSVILVVEYCLSAGKFIRLLPKNMIRDALFVNSVYYLVALLTMSSIVMPKASTFAWAFYKVYLGIAMIKFSDIIMKWYDEDSKKFLTAVASFASLESAIDGKCGQTEQYETINMRTPPCCLCLCCPRKVKFTLNKVRLLRLSIYQMPYIHAACLFLLISLNLSGYLQLDNLKANSGDVYLTSIMTISFVVAMWGLFLLFSITKKYRLVNEIHFKEKAVLFKILVVLINMQTLIIDILAAYDVIACNEFLSRIAMAAVIKDTCAIVEVFLLGNLNFALNMVDYPYDFMSRWSEKLDMALIGVQ